MPAPELDLKTPTQVAEIAVRFEPAHSAVYSLLLLVKTDELSGLGEWVMRTSAAFTSEERQQHCFVINGFYFAIVPQRNWPTFTDYLDYLADMDPVALRDKMLQTYAHIPCLDETDFSKVSETRYPPEALTSVEAYIDFLRERFEPKHLDEEIETRAYSYVIDPPAMQELVVTHLRMLWEKHLAAEWKRVEPILKDSVAAFQQIDFSGMSKLEAAKLITGQDLTGDDWWEASFKQAKSVIFVPNAHIGPYLGKFHGDESLEIIFGARIPQGVQVDAPDLNRTEIVVRLNALADDTRLQILKLVSEQGELRSQDIMELLELSQSAASRHLKQLTATGYLLARRCSGAKCYQLNPERIEDTLAAISAFILG